MSQEERLVISLHFPLYINETAIGYFTARRIKGDMEPDSINLYEIKVWTTYPGEGDKPSYEFEVHHRYGDGAWKLILTAMGILDIAMRKDKAWNPNGLTQKDFGFIQSLLHQEAIASTKLDGETHPV